MKANILLKGEPEDSLVEPVHVALKGRARYRIRPLYRSEGLKQHLERTLAGRAGIERVSVSVLTSNVLVIFSSAGDSPQTISDLLRAATLEFEGSKPPPPLKKKNPEPKKEKPSPGKFSQTKVRKLLSRAKEQEVRPWHLKKAEEAIISLGSSRQGLSPEEAAHRLQLYGPNLLPESVPRSKLSMFASQFKSLPVALLGAASLLSVFTGGLADAAVILSVVAINAVIGFTTESQSEKVINSLKSLVRPYAHVIRGGTAVQISAEQVVPGDVILLKPGVYVPADCRVFGARNLSVDESALTGESMPAIKSSHTLTVEVPLADRNNMVYMGTLITGGQGLAIAVATARSTELGHIQAMVGEATTPETPMEMQLHRIGNQLVYISVAVCGLVFFIGLLRGYGFLQMLKSSISLAVAAVPEGLPAVATTTLAIGIWEMRKHKVLIRKLEAVDTLGSVQSICLDKTGTITMNRMSVVRVSAGMKKYVVSDGSFYEQGRPVNPYGIEELLRILHIGVLCNETELVPEGGSFVLNGSATENALVELALANGTDVLALRKKYKLQRMDYRSENRNFMASHHEILNNGRLIALKGSPSEVLTMCKWEIVNGRSIALDENSRAAIQVENERMAGEALRMLGLAYKQFEGEQGTEAEENSGFVWLGMVGMRDPVRKGVKELIGVLRGAGVEPVMITGDQSPTAYAIAKEIELGREGQVEILDSTRLADLDPEVIKALSGKVEVFSRVSPKHKLQIVQALQSAGKVVAMTGDGINDGPALKAADIGIAMGNTGTDVAREIADVIVEDDNLETLVVAVSRGRTIYNNIRKSVHYLLATNTSEVMVTFAAISAGLGQPLSATQLLWINLISDIFPGIALALEAPEPDVLSRPPRPRNEPILKGSDFKRLLFEGGVLSAGTLAAYGYGIARYGMGQRASTIAFTSLATGQLLHAYSCRSETTSIFEKGKLPPNKYLGWAVGGSLALQALTLIVPGLRRLIGTVPIGFADIGVAGAAAVFPFIVNEATKKGGPGRGMERKSQ